MCHFAGGAGRNRTGAGRRGTRGGADAAGRGEGGGAFGHSRAEQSSAGVLAHVKEGRVVEEEG